MLNSKQINIIFLLLILKLSVLGDIPLMAWPENVRLGYSSCISCHVSPSGGGVLTEYGKGISSELSTIQNEKFIYSDWGLFNKPKNVLVGGNIRNVYLRQKAGEFYRDRNFLMQGDLELALMFGQISAAGSVGVYGLDYQASSQMTVSDDSPELESRRFYLKYQPNENTIFRVGKFFPNFGLMLDDHTESIRSVVGYGQGEEKNTFEAGFYNEIFSVVVSIADQTEIAKLELYGDKAIYSVSLQSNEDKGDDLAIAYKSGLTKHWYVLGEVLLKNLMDQSEFYYLRSGYEIYSGFLPYFKYTDGKLQTWSYGIQILPIAHFEFILEMSLSKDYGDVIFLTNYYL